MKPYGMDKRSAADQDVAGCRENGRATAIYALNGRAYHSLRNGKKNAARRTHKRQARHHNKQLCKQTQ